jgi:F0F1-type ATP synthase assembly protein I
MSQLDKKNPLNSKTTKNYLKYSGMGFQLIAALLLGILAGNYLDKYFQNETPFATLFCLLFMLSATLFAIIRQISKDN